MLKVRMILQLRAIEKSGSNGLLPNDRTSIGSEHDSFVAAQRLRELTGSEDDLKDAAKKLREDIASGKIAIKCETPDLVTPSAWETDEGDTTSQESQESPESQPQSPAGRAGAVVDSAILCMAG